MSGEVRGGPETRVVSRPWRPNMIQASIWLALVATSFGLSGCRLLGQSSAQPDVFLISIDTLRADHLGVYGYDPTRAQTPNIDRLAGEGVLFEHAVSPVPITLPSHASMLTGLIPPRHGVRDNGSYRLPESIPTLAERLKAHGYQTAAFIGGEPLASAGGLAPGFDLYDDDMAPRSLGALPQGTRRERYAEEVFGAAEEWLGATAEDSSPVFAFIHLFDPHSPYEKPLPPSGTPSYDGEIAYVDRALGDFLAGLGQGERSAPRLIIVTSDHGEGLGEHGESSHTIFVYESTLHVPLILHWPERLAPRRVPTVVGVIDIAPTILELLGLPGLEDVDGRSLVALAGGTGSETERRSFYFESLYGALRFGWAPLHGIREGSVKYINAPRAELYDLDEDPGESTNLLEGRENEVARFVAQLRAIGDGRHAAYAADEATSDALERLGYIGSPVLDSASASRSDPKDRIEDYEQFRLARNEALSDRLDSALEIMADLEPSMKASPFFYLEWGNFAGEAEQWEQAIQHYRSCLELNEFEQDALLNLGVVYAKTGAYTQALDELERLLAVNPDHPEGLLYAGLVKQRYLDDPEGAREYYDRFLEVAPRHPRADRVRQMRGNLPSQ